MAMRNIEEIAGVGLYSFFWTRPLGGDYSQSYTPFVKLKRHK